MIHLGDITKIDGRTAPVVDVIIGGSPCQDLSMAGKRAGLSGERSGLYMEQIRIIKEMRESDVLRGRTGQFIRPRYMVWENVPGAFSCNKDADFAAVLEEAVKVVEPEAPPVSVPEKGWPTSGCLHGVDGGWSIAWRVLDAQFWGVPQRRRRIALVADFGGMSAPEILFVRKSLSGDPEQGKSQREEAAGDAGNGTGEASAYTLKIRGGCSGGGKGALVQTELSATLSTLQDQTLFHPIAYGISAYESNAMKSGNPHSGIYAADTSRTLDSGGCCNPACNQGGIAVAGFSAKAGAKAGSCGAEPEKSPSLLANRHDAAVVYDFRGNGDGRIAPTITGDHQSRVTDFTGIVLNDQGGERMSVSADGISPTIRAEMHGNIPAILKSYQSVTGPLMANSHPGSYTGQDAYSDMLIVDTVGLDIYGGNVTGDVAASLTASTAKGAGSTGPSVMHCYGLDSNKNGYTEKAGTLQSHQSGGMQELCCDRRMVVRRLTPLECERLQGFPSRKEIDIREMSKDEYIAWNLQCGNIIADPENGKVYATRGPGGVSLKKPKELSGSIVSGYKVVSIRNGTTKMQCRIHRIIWISANGVLPDGYCIDHINNDKLDNRLSNLQLLTPAENSHKARADGLYKTGEDNHATKIDPELHDEIAYLYETDDFTIRELAEIYGISKSRIGQIVHEIGWTDIGEWVDSKGKTHKPAVSTYTNALIRYGEKNQTIVAIEELSECAKELCKVLRGQPDYDHLAEEIADAGIMLEQLVMIYGIGDSVRRFMDAKIKRLDDRLREEAYE